VPLSVKRSSKTDFATFLCKRINSFNNIFVSMIDYFYAKLFIMLKKNIFSILLALLIMYLSLAPSSTFKKVSLFDLPFQDKIVHFLMYFSLMSVLILENRNTIRSNLQLFMIAIIPLFYGILMEILQSTLTVSRSGSIFDAIFNLAGIIVSLLLWLLIKPFIKSSIR
jgi:VanZ family protein